MSISEVMPAPGWVPIQDPRSNGGEPVSVAYVNLRQASGLGVHVENGRRVLKARFPDGGERTLQGDYAGDGDACEALLGLLKALPRT